MDKPGIKTTEFWTTISMAVLAALNKKLGLDISENVLMTLAGLLATYILSRGWAKSKANTVVNAATAIALILATAFLIGCATSRTTSDFDKTWNDNINNLPPLPPPFPTVTF